MAWVRRVRTASGATAVQIAESINGRRRIVRHVGSARDETDLGLLMQEAHRLLEDDRQGVLDLGITPVAAKVVMAPPPGPQGLFREPSRRLAGTGDGVALTGSQDVIGASVRGPCWGLHRSRVRRRER